MVNAAWLNIFDVVVASPILPVQGYFVMYFFIALHVSSINVTPFFGILICGGCVAAPVPGLLFSDCELGPDVGNGSSEMP